MRKLKNMIGVAQGAVLLFEDFANDGPMWSEEGDREVRHAVRFDEPFLEPPTVTYGVFLWDIDHTSNARGDLFIENVTTRGFDLVFRTWSDTRIARLKANWMAIGPVAEEPAAREKPAAEAASSAARSAPAAPSRASGAAATPPAAGRR